jgi:hypothetical protein
MKDIIKKGSFGERVKRWQNFLMSAGYNIRFADGAFGPVTEAETIKFQAANGLKPDGVVGPKTWSFVLSVSNNTPLSSRFPKQDYNSMVEFYGPVGENQTSIEIPYPFVLAWDSSVIVKKITCNKRVAEPVYKIFEETLKAYGLKEVKKLKLDVFGGCLNVRKMRGGSSWSTHSWGAAIDLDPDNNQLRWGRDRASFAKPAYNDFWKIVQSHGATSLGLKRNMDYQHFQFAEL